MYVYNKKDRRRNISKDENKSEMYICIVFIIYIYK